MKGDVPAVGFVQLGLSRPEENTEMLCHDSYTDRGVSPVIGVVLMVAVTIILAATIGAFVFGLAPTDHHTDLATVVITGEAGDGNVTLIHEGGDPLDLDEHTLLADGSVSDGNDSLSGEFSAGERRLVEGIDASGETRITLRHDDSGEIVTEATVLIEE